MARVAQSNDLCRFTMWHSMISRSSYATPTAGALSSRQNNGVQRYSLLALTQPAIDFEPDAENMARLTRAAHRLQATRVLVLASTEAMKHMSPSQSLSLYSALGFDLIGASQKTESIEEINRRKPGASRRAAARGLPERQFEPQDLLDLAAKFAGAFFEVVTTSSLALPVTELDDKLNLHLFMARAALTEERRKRAGVFLQSHKRDAYYSCEISLLISDLDVRAETVQEWYKEKISQGMPEFPSSWCRGLTLIEGYYSERLTSQDLRALVPTEAEDRDMVQKFSSKFK